MSLCATETRFPDIEKSRDMASSTTSNVYVHVIEDVISKVREEFINNGGPGDSVVNELQGLWELKMMQAGAVFGPMEGKQNGFLLMHMEEVYLLLCFASLSSTVGAYLHIVWNVGGFLTTLGCMGSKLHLATLYASI